MAELYNQVRQSNSKYIPKFIGSNFDTLKAVGDSLQERYNRNQDLTNSLAIQMSNDKYHPNDQYIGDEHYNKLNNLVDEVSNSDDNFENSSQVISQAVKDYATDKKRIAALDNAKRYEEYLNLKHKLGSKAVDFTHSKNQDFIDKGTINEDNSLNIFEHGLEERLDYDKQKEQYFNQIEADLKQKGYSQDQINAEFLKSTLEGGISVPTIASHAKNAFIRHITTPEYEQEKNTLLQDGYTLKQANSIIQDSILKTGLERVHSINKEDLERHSEAYLKGLLQPEESPFTPTSPGSAKVNTSLTPLVDINDSTRTMTNSEVNEYYKKNPPAFAGVGAGVGVPKIAIKGIPEDQKGSYTYQFNHIANNASERQKQIAPKNKELFKKEFELAKENSINITESGEQLTKDNSSIYENYLKSAGLNAPTLVEGESEPKTLKEVIKDLNLDPRKDKIELIPSLLNRVSPNSKLGANIEGEIYVNGHPIKSFATRLSDQFDSASTELNDIFQNSLYKGSDTYTKEQPKIGNHLLRTDKGDFVPVYYTSTVPINGKFDTEVHVGISKIGGYQSDGTPIIEKPDFNNNEIYTAQEFKAKQTEISKHRLKNVYGSGQMTNNDLKAFGTE